MEARGHVSYSNFLSLSLETRTFTEPGAKLAGRKPQHSSCLFLTVLGLELLKRPGLTFSMGAGNQN